MSAIVQICFKHSWNDEELHAAAKDFAVNVKPGIQGLIWKIFVKDSAKSESCGIYLFDSRESAEAYLQGERVASLKSAPGISNITTRISETMEVESILAGAPLEKLA